MKKNEIIIVYDGECPFCSDFVSLNRLKDLGYVISIINAREVDNPLIENFSKKYNFDDGMIVINDQVILYGYTAARFISNSYSQSSLRGLIYRTLLSNKTLGRISYKIFVKLRKLYLKIAGIKLINEKK